MVTANRPCIPTSAAGCSAGLHAIDSKTTYSQWASPTLLPTSCAQPLMYRLPIITFVCKCIKSESFQCNVLYGLPHGLLAVTILCYPLVWVHCWPVADFFIAKQTSLHPFDFVRNLFHYLFVSFFHNKQNCVSPSPPTHYEPRPHLQRTASATAGWWSSMQLSWQQNYSTSSRV